MCMSSREHLAKFGLHGLCPVNCAPIWPAVTLAVHLGTRETQALTIWIPPTALRAAQAATEYRKGKASALAEKSRAAAAVARAGKKPPPNTSAAMPWEEEGQKGGADRTSGDA